MVFRLCLVIMWLCFSGFLRTTWAQSFSEVQYKTEHGLPSNEAFFVVQDIEGYIWIATDKGITRFDGREFYTYSTQDGLSSAVIYKLLASPLGGIVFYGSDNRVGIIQNDSISYFAQYEERLQTIYSTKAGIVVSHNSKSEYVVFEWNGQKKDKVHCADGHHIIEFYDTLISCGSTTSNLPGFFIKSNGKTIPLKNIHQEVSWASTFGKYNKHKIIANDSLFTLLDSNNVPTHLRLSGKATSAGFLDSKGRFWMGLHNGGIEVISLNKTNNRFHLLRDYTVSSMHEASDGTVWVSTLRHGVIKLRASHCQPIIKGETNRIFKFNNHLVAAQNFSSIQFYDLTNENLRRFETTFEVADFIIFGDELQMSINPETDFKLPYPNVAIFEAGNTRLGIYKGQAVGLTQFHLTLKNQENDTTHHLVPSLGRGYSYFTQVYGDTIYVGRTKGLYRLLETNNAFVAKRISTIPATCMLKTKFGFVFGTKGHGLIFTNRNFNVLRKYSTLNGISGNFISFIRQKNDTLICGSDKGLNFITQFSDPAKTAFHSAHISDGLWSETINDLVIVNNDLYVATDKGVQKLSAPYFSALTENPSAVIEHLNGKPVKPLNMASVPAGTRNIKVGLNTIFFHEAKNYIREYRLLGDNENWGSTTANELEFLNLKPGDYELQFRVKLPHLDNYSTAHLKFRINSFFYENLSFKIGVACLLLVIFSVVRYLRNRGLRERTSMLVKQEQLRYQALTSQLNPHFIFNALGSIQNLIITGKNSIAAEYLASFSALFDKTLRNTNHLFISLADEMAFIDEYVGIEKSRFEKPIEFNWYISDNVNPQHVLVPTMFLQPYIENAIIHGINPLGAAGKIDVRIEISRPNVIRTIILDNGIGIEKARKNQSKRARKSMAMRNIQSRLQTMEKLYKNTFSQKSAELMDENGNVLGTEVTIEIPYKLKPED